MWPGIVIILILLAMLIYLKAPKKEPVPTDEPRTADLPNPFLIDSRLDNDPANVPIQRPRPIALDARGRPITMPLIRWAQAQYERGQMFAMNPETAGQRLDTSYYQAVAILRTVEGGVVPRARQQRWEGQVSAILKTLRPDAARPFARGPYRP